MRTNISPIFFRELRSLFYSPIAYIVTFVFLVVAGYFWMIMLGGYIEAGAQMAARRQPMLFQQYLIMGFVGNLTVTLLFVMPFLSMRFFAEEKRSGTIETLFTLPFSDVDILLGKYFSGLALLGMLVGIVAMYPVALASYADIHWPPVAMAYVGLFLVGALFLAIGTFCSSLTENQVVAAALTFGSCLMLFVLNWATQGETGFAMDVLTQIGVMEHFNDLGKGLVHMKDLTYFALFIGFLLFATLRVLESKKWR
jgi:ABC-2 type transport system permease protein